MIRPILCTGGRYACPECGKEFQGISAFDRHRDAGICAAHNGMKALGLRRVENVWRLAPVTEGEP
jgi:hypothetical protein